MAGIRNAEPNMESESVYSQTDEHSNTLYIHFM